MNKAVLVYQGGLANVFKVDCFNMSNYGRNAQRLLQGSFLACEMFLQGLTYAGWTVTFMYCNQAGDIIDSHWKGNLEDAPFFDKFNHPLINELKLNSIHETIINQKSTKQEVTDQIYDTIMNNVGMSDHHTRFPFNEIDNPHVNANAGTIYFELNNKAYLLRITEKELERGES